MKLLLVYPPITIKERFGSSIGHSAGRYAPLGILYLASSARERGHDVAVIDAEAERLSPDDIARMAADHGCGVVGISATTVAFHRAAQTAEAVRNALPDAKIVIGGPHASAVGADVLHGAAFDYAVMGEGEVSFSDLLDGLDRGGVGNDIKGIARRLGDAVVENPACDFISDLDTIPFPAYDLVPDISEYNPPATNYRRLPVMGIITSRGCPNKCTFCGRNMGDRLRLRGAANVADEIELLIRRFGVREISFLDDTFTYQRSRIEEMFVILRDRGISFPWTCKSRVDTVDYGLLELMKRNGCWQISFGIESGSDEILKNINKNIKLETAREAVSMCSRLGIRTRGGFIIGNPGETAETIELTIKAAVSMKLDYAVVTINTPLPGTLQFSEASRYGAMITTDWSLFNLSQPVFLPHGITEETIRKKQREFYIRFYFRPAIMWRNFIGFFSRAGLRRFLAIVKSLPFVLDR